jgi:hypothetical protein
VPRGGRTERAAGPGEVAEPPMGLGACRRRRHALRDELALPLGKMEFDLPVHAIVGALAEPRVERHEPPESGEQFTEHRSPPGR